MGDILYDFILIAIYGSENEFDHDTLRMYVVSELWKYKKPWKTHGELKTHIYIINLNHKLQDDVSTCTKARRRQAKTIFFEGSYCLTKRHWLAPALRACGITLWFMFDILLILCEVLNQLWIFTVFVVQTISFLSQCEIKL